MVAGGMELLIAEVCVGGVFGPVGVGEFETKVGLGADELGPARFLGPEPTGKASMELVARAPIRVGQVDRHPPEAERG